MLADRLTAQLLAGPGALSVGAVVERLLVVQAQDLRAARLGVRARSTGLSSSDVDAALESRELVVTWVNRGTLHLIRSEDYPWLHALTTPQLAVSNQTRLAQEGVSPAQAALGVEVVRRELTHGPCTRQHLRDALAQAGVPVARQAFVHVMLFATLQGICVRGPMIGKEQAFVLVHDWLPPSGPVDRDRALVWLASRYLAGHGPSSDRDLAKWAGITLGDARRGLSSVSVPSFDVAEVPGPRLLGGFDELLMGWESRTWVLGDAQGVVTMNGIFKAIALVRGRAVGTWTLPKGKVSVAPFAPLSAAVTQALAADAVDVERFLGS